MGRLAELLSIITVFISFYFSTFGHVVSAHAAGHDKDEEKEDMGGNGGLGYMNPANSSWAGGAEHDQPE